MTGGRITAAALGVALVLVYAGGSGYWVENASTWYLGLKRPLWQPPNVVFGIVWPYNFIMLGIAMYVLAQRATSASLTVALVCFGASVTTALVWSYLFYGPHELVGGTIALVATTLLTIPLVVIVFQTSVALGWALVPYQLWLGVATSLCWGYAALNR